MVGGYLLHIVLVIAGLGSAILVCASMVVLLRRKSLSYFLVTLALGMLVLRSVLGGLVIGNLVSSHVHHVLEHVLDIVVIGLLVIAIIAARRIELEVQDSAEYSKQDD